MFLQQGRVALERAEILRIDALRFPAERLGDFEESPTVGPGVMMPAIKRELEEYPELDDVKPWPRYGTRNVRYGNILNCPINTTSLTPPKEPN